MSEIRLPPIKPRWYQRGYYNYYTGGGKRGVFVWHRRAGKDLTALNTTCDLAHERAGVYWHCLPVYEQARKAIWNGFTRTGERIIDLAFPPKLVRRKNEQQMFVELYSSGRTNDSGAIIQLVGSDNIDSLVGSGPVGVTFSEFSIAKPSSWNFVRPILRENGGWASFIFTPRGFNHAHDLYEMAGRTKGWTRESLTIEQTDLKYYDPRDDSENPRLVTWREIIEYEREEGMPEELVQQEYFCDFNAALVGAYYGEAVAKMQKEGRICQFDHDRDQPVYITSDLGISDDTALWFWKMNGDGSVDILDHYSACNKALPHYFQQIHQREEKLGFKIQKLFIPHDGKARTLLTGSSVAEACAEEFGVDRMAVVPDMLVEDGIQAARAVLSHEGTRIHTRCDQYDGIAALRQYHRQWDEDKRVFKTTPEHDWSSHAADALRYLAVVIKLEGKIQRSKARTRQKKKPAALSLDKSFNLEELHASRRQRRR